MASVLDRYGIKEVCDFTFYTINSSTGKPEAPALYLDTLKVSTLEQTAELVEAKGGKGNVTLLSWDINKELNVTLEDALFSAKSLAIMFGNGTLKDYTGDNAYIMRTETFTATGTTRPAQGTQGTVVTTSGWTNHYEGPDGKLYLKVNPKFYDADGNLVASALVSGDTYFCSYDITVSGSVIDVSSSSFPGTYYCVGDTYVRNAKSGKDEFFQIIIPKAKVQSQNTLTMQAEGDPSTFNMSLKVMKPDDGVMIKLVKYDAVGGSNAAAASATGEVAHNHVLSHIASASLTSSATTDVTIEGVTSSTGLVVTPATYTSTLIASAGAGTVTLTTNSAAVGTAYVQVDGKGVIEVTITAPSNDD